MGTHDSEMIDLHAKILDGEADIPSRWSSEGRRYRKWKKTSEKHASAMERQRRRAGGATPVRGEKPHTVLKPCLLYTSPSPRDRTRSRMPSSA